MSKKMEQNIEYLLGIVIAISQTERPKTKNIYSIGNVRECAENSKRPNERRRRDLRVQGQGQRPPIPSSRPRGRAGGDETQSLEVKRRCYRAKVQLRNPGSKYFSFSFM